MHVLAREQVAAENGFHHQDVLKDKV
jgi:hypothetical protein